MPRKGLGKGLDVLIPDFYDENFDSNSPQSLEDMLGDKEEVEGTEPSKEEPSEQKNIFEEIQEAETPEEEVPEIEEVVEEAPEEEIPETEEVAEEIPVEEDIEDSPKEEKPIETASHVNDKHVDEVKEIVNKNPRITLWSSRSSAVLRYLRKTEPEFSISKEASSLIEEAISKKYPEIWDLFDDF